MIIYKITNKINGKIYVGQTTRKLYKRWNEHVKKKETNQSYSILKSAIQKYGKENFTKEIIDIASDINELNLKEIKWIKDLNTLAPNGYNLTEGGLNCVKSPETLKKLSESLKLAYKNGNIDIEARSKKISLALTGQKLTKDHKKSLSKSSRYKKPRKEGCYKGVSISRKKWRAKIYIDDVNFVLKPKCIGLGTFDTALEAAKAYDKAVIKYWNGQGYLNFPKNIKENESEVV